MDDNGRSKITSIRQIVKFKEFFKKWQLVALGPKSGTTTPSTRGACTPSTRGTSGGMSPEITWMLRNSNVHCDSDDDSCQSQDMPSDVPRGYLAVYVGSELRRFIIPTCYLSDHLFKVLLEKVEEEFGFDHIGGLTIPCDIETFKYLLQCMENHRKKEAGARRELEHAVHSNAGEASSSV